MKEQGKQEPGKEIPSLKRASLPAKVDPPPDSPGVSAGPVDKVIELAFNPTREKIREVTIVDRMQGRLFPQLDMVNMMFHYCIEIAQYRLDKDEYMLLHGKDRPIPPDAIDEFLFRTAQWQKSVAGKNLERATDIALAETETRPEEGEDISGHPDAWKE